MYHSRVGWSSIIFVTHITSRAHIPKTQFTVELMTVEESRLICSKFGSFFLGSKDSRPAFFKSYSIRNLLTQESSLSFTSLLQDVATPTQFRGPRLLALGIVNCAS